MLPKTLLRAPAVARVVFPAVPRSSIRFYSDQPSSSHPAHAHAPEPQTPPKPKNFFRKEKIGLEVTPLMALIGTIVIIATGAIVRNLVQDPDIHSRHGVEVDDKLKKVLKMGEDQKEQTKSSK